VPEADFVFIHDCQTPGDVDVLKIEQRSSFARPQADRHLSIPEALIFRAFHRIERRDAPARLEKR
jgi:hypothetical protein